MKTINQITRLSLIACLSLLFTYQPALAQTSANPMAWLGIPPPGGLALPPQLSVLEDSRFSAFEPTVPAGEEGFTELEGDKIHALVEDIVGFSLQSHASGQLMWGRVSGFPAAEVTAEWVAEQYREAGLQNVEVQRYRADADMWWPDHWEVRLLGNSAFGAESGDIILASSVPARGTSIPSGLLTAPVVFVGDVGDFSNVDVQGKIAIQRRKPPSGAASQRTPIREGAQALFERGAVAVLNFIDQPGNMHVRDFSGCERCFNIGGADGRFLTEIYQQAENAGLENNLKVRMYLDADMLTGLTAQNTIGIIPGDSDEIVVVNAHLDGWYGGAGDNADGLAVQVALARHFAKPENRPARTLVFVASGGHHSTGLNGPQNFVSMNPELSERTVLVLNLEHPSQYLVNPESFELQRTEQPLGWGISNLAPFLIDLTNLGVERYEFQLRPDYSSRVPGDLGRYASLGVPRVQGIHAAQLYHTSGDIAASISPNGLERAARFHRFFIDEVASASRDLLDPEQ